MMTPPSFMIASMASHSSTWLFSIRMTGSPLPMPCSTSHAASLSLRVTISPNVNFSSEPSSSTIHKAVASLPRA